MQEEVSKKDADILAVETASNASSEKVRYGAPDGPRQRPDSYDGSEPLDYPGHEAVAQFLAASPADQPFKSLSVLAADFNVTRMTVHRWKHDRDVLRRARWLSMSNALAGDLAVRREWPR